MTQYQMGSHGRKGGGRGVLGTLLGMVFIVLAVSVFVANSTLTGFRALSWSEELGSDLPFEYAIGPVYPWAGIAVSAVLILAGVIALRSSRRAS